MAHHSAYFFYNGILYTSKGHNMLVLAGFVISSSLKDYNEKISRKIMGILLKNKLDSIITPWL